MKGDTRMTLLQFILLLMAFLGGVIGWVLCKLVYGIG